MTTWQARRQVLIKVVPDLDPRLTGSAVGKCFITRHLFVVDTTRNNRTGPEVATTHFIWVIHTTSVLDDADTEDGFSLGLTRVFPNPDFELWLDFPSLPHDERERGRTDQYRFNLSQNETQIPMELLDPSKFMILTKGRDAWLPESIWIIGQDVNRARRLLVGIPFWPSTLWFSQDESEGRPQRSLDEGLN